MTEKKEHTSDAPAKKQKKSRRKYRGLRIALLIIVVPVAIVVCAIALVLFTESGRMWSTQKALQKMNSDTLHIRISDLESPVLGEWRMGSLSVVQNEVSIVSATNLVFTWQPSALFRKQLIIDELIADQLFITIPESEAEPEPEPVQKKPLELSLPDLPNIVLNKFLVTELSVEPIFQNITGEQFALQLGGHATLLKEQPPKLLIHGMTDNVAPTQFSIEIDQQQPNELALLGHLQESGGGMLGTALRLPVTQLLDIELALQASTEGLGYRFNLESLRVPLFEEQLAARGAFEFAPDFSGGLVENLMLNVAGTEHQVDGGWNDDDLDIAVNIDQFPLSLLAILDVPIDTGTLDADIQLSGAPNQPHFSAHVNTFTDLAGESLHAEFIGNGSQQNVTISSLTVQYAQSEVLASGVLDMLSKSSDLDVGVSHLNIETVRNVLEAYSPENAEKIPQELQLELSLAQGHLNGNLFNPDGNLTLVWDGEYLDQPFHGNGSVRREADNITLEQLELQVEEALTRAEGTFDMGTQAIEMSFDTDPFSLEMAEVTGFELPAGLEGQLDGSAEVSGTLADLTVSADLSLLGSYQQIPYAVKVQGRRQASEMIIDSLTLDTSNTQVLDVEGRLNAENIDLQMNIERLPTTLMASLGVHLKPGEFTAAFGASGPITAPDIAGELSYVANVSGYNQQGSRENLALGWKMTASTNDTLLLLNSEFFRGSEQSGDLTITVPPTPYLEHLTRAKEESNSDVDVALPLLVDVDGIIDLQALSFFLDPEIHQLGGKAEITLDLDGDTQTPVVTGKVLIRDTYYENPVIGTGIEKLNCQLELANFVFAATPCSASDGDRGSYDITGNIRLPPPSGENDADQGEIDLNLTINNANVIRRPELQSYATGDVTLQGDFQNLTASGELEISPLEASLDAQLSSGIPKIDVERVLTLDEYQSEAQASSGSSPVINLDLLIATSQQAYLRGRGLETELRGDIKLSGTVREPEYRGEFNTVRGELEIFNKKFDLQTGVVSFADSAMAIDIEGLYKEGDLQITAGVTGSAEDLAINLSASPSMAEDEILSFIIFGESVQSISPFEALQLASAVQQLRGGGSFNPLGSARKALGVDTLSIESETLEDESTGINVGVGKYINDKVYLELERTQNPSQPWRGSLDVELTPRLNVESTTGTNNGAQGVEFTWKKDY